MMKMKMKKEIMRTTREERKMVRVVLKPGQGEWVKRSCCLLLMK